MSQDKLEFDRQFDVTFEETVKVLPTKLPDPTASWERVQKQVAKKTKMQTRLKVAPYVAASFILGAVVFGSPAVTKAFTPFWQSIKNVQQGVISFIFGNEVDNSGKSKTSSPKDNSVAEGENLNVAADIEKNFSTVEEASGKIGFGPFSFDYLQSHYKIKDIRLFFRGQVEKANKVMVLSENEKTRDTFILNLELLERNQLITSGSDQNAGQLETIQINGNTVYMFTTNDGRLNLEYLLGNVHVSISGKLSKTEGIEIAQNIK
jgi:hypothetical protein